jgi:hypothetical protein
MKKADLAIAMVVAATWRNMFVKTLVEKCLTVWTKMEYVSWLQAMSVVSSVDHFQQYICSVLLICCWQRLQTS